MKIIIEIFALVIEFSFYAFITMLEDGVKYIYSKFNRMVMNHKLNRNNYRI